MNELIRTFNERFQARSNHRRENPTNTSKTIPTAGAFIFYLPSRNPTYPTNSNSNFLFRFVKSTSLANNFKFCSKNKFSTGSQLFVSYNYYIIFQHELFFPLALLLLHTECKFLLDLNYSCPTDTSTTIIVPTIYLLLQLSFEVSKRSSHSKTKVPHQIIRDLLSSESFTVSRRFETVKV